ncbi:MAG TPA: hypothetical protein ACFYD4_06580, partial [Candidatus Wunengus sp. YC61]|uniref:hypothetical protein n=1 Tax=Candidatus Wunengus sp. YC61 TaxID=3367698 RepID=UPI0040276367
KYYIFLRIDIAIRNQFPCIQKLIIPIKMLFNVYFFNNGTMNTTMNYWIKLKRCFFKRNLQLKFLGKKCDLYNLEEICNAGGFTRDALSI